MAGGHRHPQPAGPGRAAARLNHGIADVTSRTYSGGLTCAAAKGGVAAPRPVSSPGRRHEPYLSVCSSEPGVRWLLATVGIWLTYSARRWGDNSHGQIDVP